MEEDNTYFKTVESRRKADEEIRHAEIAAKFIAASNMASRFADAGIKPDAKFEVLGADMTVEAYWINRWFYIGFYEEAGIRNYFMLEEALTDRTGTTWAMTESCHLNSNCAASAKLVENYNEAPEGCLAVEELEGLPF